MARNRSTVLDATSVRRHAAAMGIHHKHVFEAKFDEVHQLEPGKSTTPGRAWDGLNIDNSRLNDVAQVLNLPSFRHLMLYEQQMQWSLMLQNDDYHHDFVEFDTFDEQDEWRSIDYAALHQRKTDELDPVPYNSEWQLTLEGNSGDCFAVFMQSDLHITQLAPLEDDGYGGRLDDEDYCFYLPPEPKALFTDKEGFGWRRFIAIRARNMPLAQRGVNLGKSLTAHELEVFAERVQVENDNKLAIDFYEFVLTDID